MYGNIDGERVFIRRCHCGWDIVNFMAGIEDEWVFSCECTPVILVMRLLLQAYMQLSEFEKSRSYFIKAGRLSPGNPEIRQELQKLDK